MCPKQLTDIPRAIQNTCLEQYPIFPRAVQRIVSGTVPGYSSKDSQNCVSDNIRIFLGLFEDMCDDRGKED